MAKLGEIVFDSARPSALARFWAAVLDGYAVRPYDAAEIERLAGLGRTPDTDPSVALDGPGPTLFFQENARVKVDRNRVHLDLAARDRRAEVERLKALGASYSREADDRTTVMQDPEGNEFCVIERPDQGSGDDPC